MNFKVGDRVVYIKAKTAYQEKYIGKIATVLEVTTYTLKVHFDCNKYPTDSRSKKRFRHLTKLDKVLE